MQCGSYPKPALLMLHYGGALYNEHYAHYTCLPLILGLKSTNPWPVCNPEAVTAAPSYKQVQPGMNEDKH